MYKIYRMIRNQNEVIYVGITKLRLSQRKAIGYKNIPDYKDCILEIIEETDDKTRENYWIDYYVSMGFDLYNIRKGYTSLSKAEYNKKYRENNKIKFIEYRKKYKVLKKEEKFI